jgi:hypothetical protein
MNEKAVDEKAVEDIDEAHVNELLAQLTEPSVDIEEPQSHLAGFKFKANRFRWTAHLVSLLLAILGGLLCYFGPPWTLFLGVPLILVGVGIAAFMEWCWYHSLWCPHCNACLGTAWGRFEGWICPVCFDLYRPKKLLEDVGVPLDLTKVDVIRGDPPLACFAMILLLAITDNQRRLRFRPKKEEFQLIVEGHEGIFELVPPPLFYRRIMAQLATLFAGLDMAKMGEKQSGTLKLKVSESSTGDCVSGGEGLHEEGQGITSAQITVQPVKHGHEVIIEWLDRPEVRENPFA